MRAGFDVDGPNIITEGVVTMDDILADFHRMLATPGIEEIAAACFEDMVRHPDPPGTVTVDVERIARIAEEGARDG